VAQWLKLLYVYVIHEVVGSIPAESILYFGLQAVGVAHMNKKS
jgi:hypothetical protein